MKQVSIRELQVNLTTLLKDLPLEITRYGKVVAKIVTVRDGQTNFVEPNVTVKSEDKEKNVTVKPPNPYRSPTCEHGYLQSMCKFDKCRKKAK